MECTVDGCDREAHSRGWCAKHYKRWNRHATTDGKYREHGLDLRGAFAHYMPGQPPESGCWEWTGGRNSKGYGVLGYGDRVLRANRVAYALFIRTIPDGQLIRHTCDNPPCVQPNHLIPGTPAHNSRDMVERGRSSRGIHRPAAKLDEQSVRAIRAAHSSGTTIAELARAHRVSRAAVRNVVLRQTWKHID